MGWLVAMLGGLMGGLAGRIRGTSKIFYELLGVMSNFSFLDIHEILVLTIDKYHLGNPTKN